MGNKSMTQYLVDIKAKSDLIASLGSLIRNEDVIYYILYGLSSSYQAFKIMIYTNLQPLNLHDFYSLLCTKKTIQGSEAIWNEATM